MQLSFTEKETQKIRETAELYRFVKELILFNEEIDPQSHTFPQTLNELRNAYDHFNRVVAAKLGIKEMGGGDLEKYCYDTLDKALGHVYRASFDALDWLNVNIRESIARDLEPFSHEAIKEVIPNYYSEIRPTIEGYQHRISELRAEKDIKSMEVGNLEEYTNIVKKLNDYRTTITNSINSIVDYDARRNRDRISENMISLRFAIILSAVSAIIGGLVTFFFTRSN